MSKIAEAVGLRQSSLYYYFSKKEDLVATLMARANVGSLALIGAIPDDELVEAVEESYRLVVSRLPKRDRPGGR